MITTLISLLIFLIIFGGLFYGLHIHKKKMMNIPDESNDIIKDEWKVSTEKVKNK